MFRSKCLIVDHSNSEAWNKVGETIRLWIPGQKRQLWWRCLRSLVIWKTMKNPTWWFDKFGAPLHFFRMLGDLAFGSEGKGGPPGDLEPIGWLANWQCNWCQCHILNTSKLFSTLIYIHLIVIVYSTSIFTGCFKFPRYEHIVGHVNTVDRPEKRQHWNTPFARKLNGGDLRWHRAGRDPLRLETGPGAAAHSERLGAAGQRREVGVAVFKNGGSCWFFSLGWELRFCIYRFSPWQLIKLWIYPLRNTLDMINQLGLLGTASLSEYHVVSSWKKTNQALYTRNTYKKQLLFADDYWWLLMMMMMRMTANCCGWKGFFWILPVKMHSSTRNQSPIFSSSGFFISFLPEEGAQIETTRTFETPRSGLVSQVIRPGNGTETAKEANRMVAAWWTSSRSHSYCF